MKIYFELEENPRGTAQQKGTAFQGGRIHHYEKKEVRALRQLYHHKIFKELYTHDVPPPQFEGPVKLTIIFNYAIKNKKKWGTPKTSRPDVDNSCKLLIDVMTDLRFWSDDSQVSCLKACKFYAERPSIYLEVEPYNATREDEPT